MGQYDFWKGRLICPHCCEPSVETIQQSIALENDFRAYTIGDSINTDEELILEDHYFPIRPVIDEIVLGEQWFCRNCERCDVIAEVHIRNGRITELKAASLDSSCFHRLNFIAYQIAEWNLMNSLDLDFEQVHTLPNKLQAFQELLSKKGKA